MRTPAEIARAARQALGLAPNHEAELLALLNGFAEHDGEMRGVLKESDALATQHPATEAEVHEGRWRPEAAFEGFSGEASAKRLDLNPVNHTIAPAPTPTSLSEDPAMAFSVDDSCDDDSLGRYGDLGLLGMGGMGEVRLVRDEQLKRNVAMKILHGRLMAGGDAVRRFVDEAVVVAQLQHPNVVPIHELGWLPDGRPYFTMKPIRGREFSQSIKAVHAASDGEAWYPAADGTSFRQLIRIFHQVCVTVAYAHSTGVVHRDLKPNNIMTGAFNDVLVVDWGLAQSTPVGGTDAGEGAKGTPPTHRRIQGTPAYMSPEQAYGRAEVIGFPTDVYALGAVLYEVISGRAPFQGTSQRDIVKQVRHSAPQPLSGASLESPGEGIGEDLACDLKTAAKHPSSKTPQRLIEICERAMQREIDRRHESVDALANEVLDWLESAEKRDRGMQEVETARTHYRQAQQHRLVGLERWREANSLFNQQGAGSKGAWLAYDASVEAQAQVRVHEGLHTKHLEAALVHAPGLREAHHTLAEMAFGEINAAFGLGDASALKAAQRRLEVHISTLSPAVKDMLKAKHKSLVGDPILTQCVRRGMLVGREEQRRLILSHLGAKDQLITLIGTPGVGKTRIALDLAAQLRADTSQTYFCDLSEVQDELGVLQLVARSLGLRLSDGEPLDHLNKRLSQGRIVLVLDNLEHIRGFMGPICRDWVEALPNLNILATSRIRLDVEGEQVVEIAPMTLLEGVELFVRCAQAAVPGFECSVLNRERLCVLVEAVDGLPLAIELAAARLRTMTLDEIVERLGQRFSLLRTGGRESVALEGALDWSWGLLAPSAQATLAQASVFRGGFNLTAAEQVIVRDDGDSSAATFEVLEELVDASLLQKVRLSDSSIRYRMLQSVRAYAGMRLEAIELADGPGADRAAQARHASFFARFGEPAMLAALRRDEDGRAMARYVEELDNLAIAIEYGSGDTAALCCIAAVRPIFRRGPAGSGVTITTRTLAKHLLSPVSKAEVEVAKAKCLWRSGRVDEARALLEEVGEALIENRAGLLSDGAVEAKRKWALVEAQRHNVLGNLESHQSNIDVAARLFDEALKLALEHNDEFLVASSREGVAVVHYARAEFTQAAEAFRDALKIYETLGFKLAASRITGNLGLIGLEQNRHDEAVTQFETYLRLSLELGDRLGEATARSRLAGVHRALGQTEEAIEQYKRSLDICREYGNRRGEGMNLGNLGLAYQNRGDYALAVEVAKQALEIHRELGARRSMGIVLGGLGRALLQMGHDSEAETVLREALPICDEVVPLYAGWIRGDLARVLAKTGTIDEARTLLEECQPTEHGRVDHDGFLICCRGFVELLDGDPEAALAGLEEARALALDLRDETGGDLGQAIRELETALSEVDEGRAQ